ncbi:coniferyl-alcohol dehydrogenase [Mycolicibacterium litorale]|uniref:3-alpha-hydroxysteroid dehydrogenase n=1 Tax=Mycolicibacterium litorale TaxID=758802 RepID=A0AAD1IGK6_9MYCO|nr:coniferyl-alcohol dehydrogenase [Mycolicibacterium litorale]MCV7414025.1 coniferyl-alcohol dehydrogenase [Mycolicibacterium litorale]TDY03091.1 NAD(P)-dependent dehydrogenase (short-subunit alcohol dehydrogenase family) [Mycolicibacterium litorale]BBY14884.1 3-alpha-hydroxysteroid dehydrogenase [Mycolicibacterium litorale]
MGGIDELWRYDGRRVVVTGCASGIGAHLVRQLNDLGAQVVGLDMRRPAVDLDEFVEMDLSDEASVDHAVAALGGDVDVLFNVAGVSSGIGDPPLVVRINFLGTRHFTESVLPRMRPGSSIVSVSSLAAASYLDNAQRTAGLVRTATVDDGIAWCADHSEELADGGYRLAKEALILYTMCSAGPLGARGIRINCTGPGVTETPILDQLRTAYGPAFLDDIPKPLGRVSDPEEQAAVLLFLGSDAASYITGQVIWVDGGNLAGRVAASLEGE